MSVCLTQARVRVRRLALGGVLAAAVALAVPASSQASAYGIQYFGTRTIDGYTIPGGQLAHYISGSGLFIAWDGANFGSIGNLCDSSIEFTYGYGSWYVKSSVHWGCSHVGQWKYTLNWRAPRGSACARLYVDDWRHYVTQQCHFVS
ncbi:MAG TPA: hypothetical protein VMJ65_14495 [Solirubrobacteraceae bacterium]|nr:hypothetical protein [Solirubrobacteraceae bacterium]